MPPDGSPAGAAGSRSAVDLTPASRSGLFWVTSDAWLLAKRSLIHTWRVPDVLVFSSVQPVLFVLLFTYVFGGAIDVGPGKNYVDYLMPGVFAQTVVFGAMLTGMGLATDKQNGLLDRFRSLPMARSALLTGRTLADLVRNTFIVLLMLAVGLAVGFRFHDTSAPEVIAGFAVLLLFSYAFSWISATIGMAVSNPEAAQSGGLIWVFPLVFASSAFAPVDTMPGWLQAFAKHQPVSVTIDASRALFQGGPLATPLISSVAWSVGIIAVFGPLAVRVYRRSTSR
ncbi:ABC transporter [Pseudofrankia sp. BMG5.36]|nr:ABC transporter [Pseudofrankia sp. BMG5.36]